MSDRPAAEQSGEAWRAFCRELFDQSKFGIELGLERMRRALAREGHPERAAPAILVAGTNGKGETAAYLAGILQAHGLTVGLYTSPHILDVRERFRVDGQPLGPELIEPVGRRALDRYGEDGEGDPRLTFFELTTLMAAKLFADSAVDVAIYEVGLGGRLDATNAIEPALSIVTAIGRDHTSYLGETIEEIAGEKAGILRDDRPAILGRQTHPEAMGVLRRRGDDREVLEWGRDFSVDAETGEIVAQDHRWGALGDSPEVPETRRVNAACAVAAAGSYLGASLRQEAVEEGLERTRWPGRYDRRSVELADDAGRVSGEVLFDAAHNPAAAEALFAMLDRTGHRPAAVVCGGMADKELSVMFARLAGGPPVWGAEIATDRAADAEELRATIPGEVLRETGPTSRVFPEALRRAHQDEGYLLVFGSIYLVGEAFELVGLTPDDLGTFW